MNFYKHHIGDYAAATSHLSFIEDAAFARLIRIYYRDEHALPLEVAAVQRLSGARTQEERDAVAVVLHEFFTQQDDGWHNKRCDEEITKASAQAETNRRIASEREERRRARFVERLECDTVHDSLNGSLHVREPSQTPDSRQEQEHKAPASPSDFRAELWARWKALPNGGGGSFLSKVFREHKPEQRVMEAMERTLEESRADPKAFLLGCLRKEQATDDLMADFHARAV